MSAEKRICHAGASGLFFPIYAEVEEKWLPTWSWALSDGLRWASDEHLGTAADT